LPLRLQFTATTQRQIREAARWWLKNRPAAQGLFRQELDRGLELITMRPGVGTQALDVPIRGVRRFHLLRIHYHLYYHLVDEDTVEILALWHVRRGNGPPL
jgi:plasmid stabilization system protein ParE